MEATQFMLSRVQQLEGEMGQRPRHCQVTCKSMFAVGKFADDSVPSVVGHRKFTGLRPERTPAYPPHTLTAATRGAPCAATVQTVHRRCRERAFASTTRRWRPLSEPRPVAYVLLDLLGIFTRFL